MALKSSFRDTVFLLNFPYQLIVGKDAFQRIDMPQPVIVSFSVPYDMESAGSSDKLQAALDYDQLYHGITAVLTSPGNVFRDIQDLAATIIGYYSATGTPGTKNALGTSDYTLSIDLPKGVLRAEGGLKYEQTMNLKRSHIGYGVSESITIEKIRCYCIVGANEYERSIKQAVFLDIEVACQHDTSDNPSSSTVTRVLGCYQDMVDSICEKVDASSFRTVEAMALFTAREIIGGFGFEVVTVSVMKPNAIANVEAAGVRITRTRSWMKLQSESAASPGDSKV